MALANWYARIEVAAHTPGAPPDGIHPIDGVGSWAAIVTLDGERRALSGTDKQLPPFAFVYLALLSALEWLVEQREMEYELVIVTAHPLMAMHLDTGISRTKSQPVRWHPDPLIGNAERLLALFNRGYQVKQVRRAALKDASELALEAYQAAATSKR